MSLPQLFGPSSSWAEEPTSAPSYMNSLSLSPKQEEVLLYLESAGTLVYDFRRSYEVTDLVVSLCTFYRSVTGKSAVGSTLKLFNNLAGLLESHLPFWQSGGAHDWVDVIDGLYKNIHRVKGSALGTKVISVFNNVVAHTFYHKMGLEVDSKLFHQIEKKIIRPTCWNVLTFADAIVGLLLFLAKAGRQCLLTGDVNAFFVDSSVLSDWLARASKLRKDAEFLGNPAAVGIDTPQYLADIVSCIKDGENMAKIFKDAQKTLLMTMVLELQMVEKRHISSLAASSFRRCPYGVFLYGDAGVGKSFLNMGLFHLWCSVRDIPKERAVMHSRNPDDKYYSGYRSHHVGVLYDDVAKHKTAKTLGIDTSLTDIITSINNTPFITNQAEAFDKGKIPFLAEWVGVTSNLADLHVDQYFDNSYAVLRRLPYRIEPIVKKEYLVPGTTKINPSLIPAGEQYPDCWEFSVWKACQIENTMQGRYEDVGLYFKNYQSLCAWLIPEYTQHIENQNKLMATIGQIGPEKMCVCGMPQSLCVCVDLLSPVIGNSVVAQVSSDEQETADDYQEFVQERIESVLALKRRLREEHKDLEGMDHMFVKKFWTKGLAARALRPDYQGKAFQELVDEIEHEFRTQLSRFQDLAVRSKVMILSNTPDPTMSSDSYLTFTPRIGGKRCFLKAQLVHVYRYILQYVTIADWSDEKRAALEVYIYEKVPQYLADGWNDPSLLQGALDFVDEFSHTFKDHQTIARETMLGDINKVTWRDAVCRWAGMQYFSRPWVRDSVNYVVSTRPGAWVVAKCSSRSRLVALNQLRSAVAWYDIRLKGNHPVVVTLCAVLASSAVVFLLSQAFKWIFKTRKQVNIKEVGRKPVVREAEKVNVWKVQERNITALDFHPQRANKLCQLDKKLKRNSVLVEFSAVTEKGRLTGTTRGLVVDNETLLINDHACYAPGTYTISVGKRTPEGVQPTFTIEVEESMVRRVPERDLAIITTIGLPALFQDISRNFVAKSFSSVGPSFYCIPQESGEHLELPVYKTRKHPFNGFEGDRGKVNTDAWAGVPERPTQKGDCGSPLVVVTKHGPVIVGIHCAYHPIMGTSFAVPIFLEDFQIWKSVVATEVKPSCALAQVKVIAIKEDAKLYSDYHKEGRLITFGQVQGYRPRPKANGGKSLLGDFFIEHGPKLGLAITDRMARPDMSSWAPQQNILAEYLCPTHSIRETVFVHGCDGFATHIINGLTDVDKYDIHTVPLSVATNGYPGVPNVDAQKFTTAAGHGHPGPKAGYISYDGEFEEWDRFREYTPEILGEIQEIYDKACRGERSHPIFTAQLKDEMLSLRKVAAKKTRGFYVCPLPYLTAMRMVSTGLTRVMVRRKGLFRHAVGLNTHSEDWNSLLASANRIPGDNWLAGDFKGFDKILSILIQNGAKRVILDVVRDAGFTDEEVLAFDTLLCDTITPTIDFFGELIMLLGGEVSGHQMTTFFNSLANVLLHLYAWNMLYTVFHGDLKYSNEEFFDRVFICVLGDDIMAKVHPDFSWYNHTSIQEIFAGIGIEYTMADKQSESTPYISYKDVTFLKRTFAEHESFPGLVVAPLEKDSIYKMLVYEIPSKSMSREEHMASVFCSATAEAFYHGRDFFDRISQLIKDAPKSRELESRMELMPIPTWYQLYERFIQSSPEYRVTMVTPGILSEPTPSPSGSYCLAPGTEFQTAWRVDPWGSTAMERSSEDSIESSDWLSTKKFRQRRRREKAVVVDKSLLTKNQRTTTHMPWQHPGEMTPAVNEKVIKRNRMLKRERTLSKIVWQTDVVYDSKVASMDQGSVDVKQGNTLFKSEPMSTKIDLSKGAPITVNPISMPQHLGDYLTRPLLIDTRSFSESSPVGVLATFNPWAGFLGSIPIKEKLQGYSLLRGNLHLKFVINGSPFYYGALMAAYTPLQGFRSETASGGGVNQLLVATSQKPHVWLNPQECTSAEMTLPFLYPYPFMEISTISNMADMGKIELVVYYALQSANGITGQTVDVQTYAWMENVEMAGPTNRPVAQADIEYKDDHQLSAMATTVADVAGKLKWVPGLGEYALATESAARMAAGVANAFGYTNVPNVSDVQPFKQKMYNLASASISEPIEKLTLDPKQEIAIGSTQYGGPEKDELSILDFCKRSSFVVATEWLTTNAPQTILYTSLVNPCQFESSSTSIAMTPMAWAAHHFQYWRGSIAFTFKVIRSPYHRGRINISWDRLASVLGQGSPAGNLNTYNVVLDLDETDEVTVEIPWAQAVQFLDVTSVAGLTGPELHSTSASPPSTSAVSNGLIQVRVLNRLTAPEASSNVAILVSVAAGADFELACPISFPTNGDGNAVATLSALDDSIYQSDIQFQADVVYDDKIESSTLAPIEESPTVYKEVFGEKITSFRQLLHRASLAKTVSLAQLDTFNGWLQLTVPIKHLPPAVGIYNNGWESVTVGGLPKPANFAPFHPLTSLSSCFIGYKGSVNVSVNVITGLNSGQFIEHISLERTPKGAGLVSTARRPDLIGYSDVSAVSARMNQFMRQSPNGGTGLALVNTKTQAALAANLPYYSNAGFAISDQYNEYNNQDILTDRNNDWFRVDAFVRKNTTQNQTYLMNLYYGSGPDFDLVFFINVPIMHKKDLVPV